MRARHRTLVAWLVVTAVVGLPVGAFVPTAERIQDAIAETNVASGRDQALRLELTLQIGQRPGVASAELISHPTGLARLELRAGPDLVERHLLQGDVMRVSRNGEMLDEHRYFLPPLFVLQADSSVTLRAALSSLDVLVDVVGLTECDESDCFVIGDKSREISRREPPKLPGLEGYDPPEEDADDLDLESESAPGPAMSAPGPGVDEVPSARIWPNVMVDVGSYEVRAIETAAGVRIQLGPIAVFDKLRVPAWILIHEPGRAPARFDVVRASQVNAPASAFKQSWLLSPVISQPEAAAP
jgi:hypothetical protein